MAAAVIPTSARPSTKLQAVAALPRVRTSGEMPPNASTLGRGVGQLALAKSLRLRHYLLRQTERWAWLAERTTTRQRLIGIAAGGSLLALALLIGISLSVRSMLATKPVVQAPTKIRWTVRSVPAGAQVVRKADQSPLGQTPWTQEQATAPGMLDVVLRLPGYKDRALSLDQSQDAQLDEALEPLPVAPPPPVSDPTDATGRKGGRRSSKGPKDGSKKGSHGGRTKLID